MIKELGRTGLLLATVLAVAGIGPAIAVGAHRCPGYDSGGLFVTGVKCSTADRVVQSALRHPGCRSNPHSGRGCRGTTHVRGWRCSGLFPGEGFDLYCISGRRKFHAGAGG